MKRDGIWKEEKVNGEMFYKDFIFIYIPNLEIGEEMPPMLDFPIEKQSICFSPLNNEYIDF